MPQGKSYRKFLSNTKNKTQLLKKFTKHLTQETTRKDHATFNIGKDTVFI